MGYLQFCCDLHNILEKKAMVCCNYVQLHQKQCRSVQIMVSLWWFCHNIAQIIAKPQWASQSLAQAIAFSKNIN